MESIHFSFPTAQPSNTEGSSKPKRPTLERTFTLYPLATLEKNQEEHWDTLTDTYMKIEDAVSRSTSLTSNKDESDQVSKDIQSAMDTFVETSNMILEGLVALGNVHPILGIAIFAFHGVITLDLTRRNNDRKVLAVKLEMRNMMCAMFQLRTLRHVHVDDTQREEDRKRLQQLIRVIAEEIKKCGSNLDYYSNKKLASKLIKAKAFERCFAEHVQTFALRRSELQMTIASYIAAGVDAANVAIAEVGAQVIHVDEKLDQIAEMFHAFNTARERDCLAFIEANGGAKQCIQTDDLLKELIFKSESPNNQNQKTLRDIIIETRTTLARELGEDLKDVMANNQSRFEKLLNVQNNNMKRISDQLEDQSHAMELTHAKLDNLMSTSIMIFEEGKLIKRAVTAKRSVRLKDPELQKIWAMMRLDQSVKAKRFVLTLRDYLMAGHSTLNSPYPGQTAGPEPGPDSLIFSTSPTLNVDRALEKAKDDAELEQAWFLKYIDVAYVQPIVEAMDEDGSGFISVKEANKFALSKPKGWSLFDWIAYWAAGWHLNLTDYRHKIYMTLQKLHEVAVSVRAVNKPFAYRHLDFWALSRIEAILRTLRPFPSDSPRDPKLVELAKSMAALQEQSLEKNLKEMSYLLQSKDDVILIAGTERLETWFLPLLHLVLQRHLEIFRVAQTSVLQWEELRENILSLNVIVSVFDTRISHLKEIFRQVHRDSSAQFAIFAYGMFHASYDFQYEPSKNTILTYRDATHDTNHTAKEEETPVQTPDKFSIIKELGPSPEYTNADLEVPDPPPNHVAHHIEGLWVGTLYAKSKSVDSPAIYFKIAPVIEKQISAVGIESMGSITILGTLEDVESSEVSRTNINVKVTFKGVDLERRMKGTYDHQKDVISGLWVIENKEGKFPSNGRTCSYANGTFLMTRCPFRVYRFRSILDTPKNKGNTPNLARQRWAFAMQAVLYQVQEQEYFWNFTRLRIVERNKWIELAIRDMLPRFLNVTRGFMSPEDVAEWARLRTQLHPVTQLFYEDVAKYLLQRHWYNVGFAVSCDACRQRIVFRRYFCITCVEDDLHNQIDFCADAQCTDSSITMFDSRDFIHSISHTLLRANRPVLAAELPIIIPQSNLRSERVKRSFREREAKATSSTNDAVLVRMRGPQNLNKAEEYPDNELEGKLPSTTLICATCKKDLTLPCWACATCTRDTLFCLDCERRQSRAPAASSTPSVHNSEHLLLRIYDSAEAKQIRLKSNNKQLEDMETRINKSTMQGLYALEDKMTEHLKIVNSVVNNLAREMGREGGLLSPALGIEVRNDSSAQENEADVEALEINKSTFGPSLGTGRVTDKVTAAQGTTEGQLNDLGKVELGTGLISRMTALEDKVDSRLSNLESKIEAILSILTRRAEVPDTNHIV